MPLGNEKNVFSVFFSLHESHGFASTRGTVVFLREARACLFRKGKTVLPVRFFHPVLFDLFFEKKSLSKSINMGSSFKNLDARNSMVKTVRDLDARFKI